MATRNTILVIDDNPDSAALLRDALVQAGYRVLVADSAAGALRLLRAFKARLVITDALRAGPTADPWAALDAIRAAAGDASLVICSGHDRRDYADHAAHGYAAFLPKPFDTAELTAAIASLCPVGRQSLAQRHGHAPEQLV